MQVSFYLDKGNKNKENRAPVFYSLTFKGERIRKKVKGVSCNEIFWNTKHQRIKAPLKNQDYNYHIEYNKIIDALENKVKELFRYILLNNVQPTKKYIVDKIESEENIELAFEFFSSFKEFLNQNRNAKAERTITGYTTACNYLKDFEALLNLYR